MMNERIRELLEQSLRWSGENVNRNLYSVYEIQQKEYEKFAKLIAAECAGIYDKIENGNRHLGTDDYLEALQRTFFGVDG